MATTLVSIRAERTNRALLVFSGPLDAESLEPAVGVLVAADAGTVPLLLGYEAVSGFPERALAVFAGTFRDVRLTLTFSGLVDDGGDPVAGSGSFAGLPPAGPRLTVYDQRLLIDLDLGVTPGGDVALRVGDEFLREQAVRMATWQHGALMADPQHGVPFSKGTLMSSRKLVEYQERARRQLAGLPGVTSAQVAVRAEPSGILRQRIALKTDQTELSVSADRQAGR